MPTFSSNRQSNSYLATIDITDPMDIEFLKSIKNIITTKNKGCSPQLRVKLAGRLGTNNPNSKFYKQKYSKGHENAWQYIKTSDTNKFDVYIYFK